MSATIQYPWNREPVVAWAGTWIIQFRSQSRSCFCGKKSPERLQCRTTHSTARVIRAASAGPNDYNELARLLDGRQPSTTNTNDQGVPTEESTAEKKSIPTQNKASNTTDYEEFSEMLGLEDRNYKSEGGKKTVAEAAPKKSAIDPAHYRVFDSLLQKSGGRGSKPMKGSKRYATRLKPTEKSSPKSAVDQTSSVVAPGQSQSQTEDSVSPRLSKQETMEAYGVMMEEFGVGLHNHPVPPGSDAVLDKPNSEHEKQILLRPPSRPDEAVRYAKKETAVVSSKVSYTEKNPFDAEPLPVVELPTLKPKPSTPGDIQKAEKEERRKEALALISKELAPVLPPTPGVTPSNDTPTPVLYSKPTPLLPVPAEAEGPMAHPSSPIDDMGADSNRKVDSETPHREIRLRAPPARPEVQSRLKLGLQTSARQRVGEPMFARTTGGNQQDEGQTRAQEEKSTAWKDSTRHGLDINSIAILKEPKLVYIID